MLAALRIIVGLVLLVSGAEKLLSPYQNFLYALQAYQMLPHGMEEAVARFLPWVELFTGLFTVLGLWTAWALRAAMVLFAGFVVVVGQALLRALPIDQCGCFGELVHLPPRAVLVFDSILLLVCVFLLRHLPKAMQWSLDRYYSK